MSESCHPSTKLSTPEFRRNIASHEVITKQENTGMQYLRKTLKACDKEPDDSAARICQTSGTTRQPRSE